MPTFTHRFTVHAPLEAVAAFHHDTRALRVLNPPPVIVQFHNIEPLAEHSLSEFTLWIGPVPIRWHARHSDVNPLRGFVDTQERGPFQSWVHRHTYREIDPEHTEVGDQITAEFGPGLWHAIISRLMWISLPALFFYRKLQTRRASQAIYAGQQIKPVAQRDQQ